MGLPFWLQTTDRRRGQAFYIFLNSGTLLIVLLVVAFLFVFILVPSFVSFTSQIFRPHLIKKSWDYLNFVLVFFAILCGFLTRNNDNNSNSKSTSSRSISSVQQDLQRHYPSTHAVNSFNRLRSFSSYPDLRQESLWLTNDERWRFYDDTHLHSYRFPSSSDQVQDHRPQQQYQAKADQDEDSVTKDIDVDISLKEVVYTPPPSSPLPPPHSPSAPPLSSLLPPPKAVRRKVKTTYQDLGHEKREEKDLKVEKFYIPQTSPAPTPTPPPPPPPPVFNKNEKRRGKGFLNSLRIKKKKQSQKSVENLHSFFDPHHPSSLLHVILHA